jgi:hypothetical protein
MIPSNHNLKSALTIRGVLRECVNSEPASKIVAQCIGGIMVIAMIMAVGFLILIAAPKVKEFDRRIITQAPRYKEPTREQLRDAHRHHGTFHSFEGQNHVWYFFDKEGRRCRLFAYRGGK